MNRKLPQDEVSQKTSEIILNVMSVKPQISIEDLALECGILGNGIKWQIKNLKKKGLLERVGKNYGGHW